MLIGIAARRMLRVEAIDQAVEKAPPAGGALAEQPVHLRRQPDHRKHLGEHLLPAHGDAVHLYQAPLAPCRPRRCAILLGRIAAAAEVARALRRHHRGRHRPRSEEHTSELQSLMRISYAVFCLKKKQTRNTYTHTLLPTTTK